MADVELVTVQIIWPDSDEWPDTTDAVDGWWTVADLA